MDVEENGDQAEPGDANLPAKALGGAAAWLRNTNRDPHLVALIRRVRRILPGDPEFGDPLSAAGEGTTRAAARVADRLMNRDAATREVSLGALQLWQAVAQRVSGRPTDAKVSIVFTDLVGFSTWSLKAGDAATLRLLRRVAQVSEPPLLDAGGRIVKRMGDGMMVVFRDATTALRATIEAREGVRTVEVEGFTPRIRAGIHTGHPQHIGGDWLGVDVNIAARVMERAARGGLIISETTLAEIPAEDLAALGASVKRLRRPIFTQRQAGVPPELAMYRVRTRRDAPGEEETDDI